RARPDAQLDAARRELHELVLADRPFASVRLEDVGGQVRVHPASVGEHECIAGAAEYAPQKWQSAAAWAWPRVGFQQVANLVAQDRLRVVVQVGEQEFAPAVLGRQRVDPYRFDGYVHVAVLAFEPDDPDL